MPRDVVAGVATQRGPAPLLAARKGVRRLRHSALRRRSAPKVGCILLCTSLRGRAARLLPACRAGRTSPHLFFSFSGIMATRTERI